MAMKPIHGSGSEPIAHRILHNAVSAANEHPSGEWGAIDKKTVTQPKFTGNAAQSVCKELVSHPHVGMNAAEKPAGSK